MIDDSAAIARRWPGLRLMAVHAHPDDESSKGAATMARYVRSGADVMVCTLTGGERGDILNKAMDRPEIRANLPAVRREEMARAREILGVRQRFLGFIDSGLPEGDPPPPLPEGCFALQKLEAAADPDRYPDAGEPWQPLKMYYFVSFHKARFTALHEEMERRGLESPYAEWFKRWDDEDRAASTPELEITTRIPCADFFGIRDQALIAHATQIDPESSWFACPLEVQQAAWPTEDYHLARSVVNTELPEDDLFAGVREKVSP